MPATNIIFAFISYVIAGVAVYYAQHLPGVNIPQSVADALPGGLAVAVAHGWDVWTGDNKK